MGKDIANRRGNREFSGQKAQIAQVFRDGAIEVENWRIRMLKDNDGQILFRNSTPKPTTVNPGLRRPSLIATAAMPCRLEVRR